MDSTARSLRKYLGRKALGFLEPYVEFSVQENGKKLSLALELSREKAVNLNRWRRYTIIRTVDAYQFDDPSYRDHVVGLMVKALMLKVLDKHTP